MVSSFSFGYIGASGRRLTPVPLAETSSPSTSMSLAPIRGFPNSPKAQDEGYEEDYLDMLTEVTDEDEVYAQQCEAAATNGILMRSRQRYDSLFDLPTGTNGTSSMSNAQVESTTTLASIQQDEQRVCASFWGSSEWAELLFDAETPLASDEDLALRSIFAPGSMPEPVTRLVACGHYEPPPTPELLDTSQLRVRSTLAVHEFRDHISDMLDFDASPRIEKAPNGTSNCMSRRQGRSLLNPYSPVTAGEAVSEEAWQLEHDPVLRYATGRRTLLPGMDHLRNVTARSATVRYDRDIEDLFHATKSFLGDCQDGECTCLDGKMHSLLVPGENFMLADNNDFDLPRRCSLENDILERMDEIVNADMFDVTDGYSDVSMEAQPCSGLHFDTMPHNTRASKKAQPLYSSAVDAVKLGCDNENASDVSDVSDTDADSLSLTQHPRLTYVDADTHHRIAYTAFDQLLRMEENETRSVFHRDTPDEDEEPEVGLAEIVHLCPRREGRRTLQPQPNSSNLNRSSFETNSGISRPIEQLQPIVSLQPTVRQRCEPYGLYSSNLSRQQRCLPRLKLVTQLLPQRKPLPMVQEEERSCSSSSSSAGSLDFADHRGFVKPLENRRLGFLDDDDASKDDSESPVTPEPTLYFKYEDLFTGDVWANAPDLTLTEPRPEVYEEIAPASVLPPPALMEVFEVEIHSRLTSMFNYMNKGQFHELPALGKDLHWILCALASDFPALTFVDSLGVAVEILVERMVASSVAF